MTDKIDEYITDARKFIVQGKTFEDDGKAKDASNAYLQVCLILQKALKGLFL